MKDTAGALGTLAACFAAGAMQIHARAIHQADGASRADDGPGLAVLIAEVAEVVHALAAFDEAAAGSCEEDSTFSCPPPISRA